VVGQFAEARVELSMRRENTTRRREATAQPGPQPNIAVTREVPGAAGDCHPPTQRRRDAETQRDHCLHYEGLGGYFGADGARCARRACHRPLSVLRAQRDSSPDRETDLALLAAMKLLSQKQGSRHLPRGGTRRSGHADRTRVDTRFAIPVPAGGTRSARLGPQRPCALLRLSELVLLFDPAELTHYG
jgi:hypothetical protein